MTLMRRPLAIRALAPFAVTLLAVALLASRCGPPPASPPRQMVMVTRPLGSWHGTGSMTLGDVMSDTGRFRISWETRGEYPIGSGSFRLTVRSAVSGRPIEIVADYRGTGRGSTDFEDGPRIYDFLVESANIDWAFTVEEVSTVYAK